MSGMAIKDFWDMTPYEVSLQIHGFSKRLYMYQKIAAWHASIGASAAGSKTRPRDLLGDFEDELT